MASGAILFSRRPPSNQIEGIQFYKREVRELPSIIDMVSQAEAEALSLKKDAERQAKEMEAAARQDAQAQIQAAQEAGRNRVAAAIAEAEEEGKHIAQEICDQEAAKATASSQRAQEALPQAVAYILERVKA